MSEAPISQIVLPSLRRIGIDIAVVRLPLNDDAGDDGEALDALGSDKPGEGLVDSPRVSKWSVSEVK